MIAEYESPEKPELYNTPRIYGLNLKHKHLPEMQKICGLDVPPVFCRSWMTIIKEWQSPSCCRTPC